MAFKDLQVFLYDDSIKLNYKDATHHYSAVPRIDYDLPVTNAKAWGKALRPKGTTTLLDETLEKKGLLTWPMGMALQELFGFYDFDAPMPDGSTERKTGFSKKLGGTLWDNDSLRPLAQADALPAVLSASKNWTRRQKKGADIGNVVHDAIEHYLLGQPFSIDEEYQKAIEAAPYESEELRQAAYASIAADVIMANLAFGQFTDWWVREKPELVGAEQLVYSKQHNISGTFDALIRINGKLVLCDWKTSNASASKQAAMPEGINYSYFIQSAIYAMAYMEMHSDPLTGIMLRSNRIDDIAIVSCRKDGGFTTIFASDLGFTVDELINWAKAVITCYDFAKKTKAGLVAHAEKEQ